jgi:FMN phosphatase YigB (HAD superfamily)
MIKLICSDVNGVLEHIVHDYSESGYYVTKGGNKELENKIKNIVFGLNYLNKSWMVNDVSYEEINHILSKRLNIDNEYLNGILIQSIKEFEWNWDLINIYQKYRQQGIKVIITTNNMDIFTKIAVPYNNFNKYFDNIYNSSDLKLLKEDRNLYFFKKISDEYELNTKEILIVDDNKTLLEEAKILGYKTYLYNIDTYNNFEKWLNEYNEHNK